MGKKATNDGSVIVAHTDDDISDGRVIFVPAMDHDLKEVKKKNCGFLFDFITCGCLQVLWKPAWKSMIPNEQTDYS